MDGVVKLKYVLLFAFHMLFVCKSIFAGEIVIEGQIIDLNGPLKGVSWIEIDAGSNTVFTKPNGRFSFRISKGNHRFEFYHVGYRSYAFDFVVSNDTLINVKLQKQVLNVDSSLSANPESDFGVFLKKEGSIQNVSNVLPNYLMYGILSSPSNTILFEEIKPFAWGNGKGSDMNSVLKNISLVSFPPLDLSTEVVDVYEEFNPRGFISPFSGNTKSDYMFIREGTYDVGDRKIIRLRILKTKSWKPLFSGHIDWDMKNSRPYELQLELNSFSLLENAHFIQINQRFRSDTNSLWRPDFQEVNIQFNVLGENAIGFFALKSKGARKVDDGQLTFEQTITPIPYKESNSRTVSNMILRGFSINDNSRKSIYHIQPLMKTLTYNAVEGVSLLTGISWRKRVGQDKIIMIDPTVRYGTKNGHLNADVQGKFFFNSQNSDMLSIGMGKRVQQFNPDNTVPQLMNSFSIISDKINYLKIFENTHLHLGMGKQFFKNTTITGAVEYQNRTPLVNFNSNYSSNYPEEISTQPMPLHQSVQFKLGLIINTSKIPWVDHWHFDAKKSGMPRIEITYTKGVPGLMGSESDFDKWRMSFSGLVNLRMKGSILYHFQAGGFLNDKRVELPDYHHFWGNQTRKAFPYLESFQLVPFYAFSNKNNSFASVHLEYRSKGFITENIPWIRNANLHLVSGGNAFTSGKLNYTELFWGFDNILKFIRVDHIVSVRGAYQKQGIRIGISGFDRLFSEN